jgi:hypothetical protein
MVLNTVQDFQQGWWMVQDAARTAGRDPEALVAGRLLYIAVERVHNGG